MTKHSMFIEIPVEVVYKMLPAVLKNGEAWLPEQVDVQHILLKRRRGRTVDLLGMIEISALLAIEDEIWESLESEGT